MNIAACKISFSDGNILKGVSIHCPREILEENQNEKLYKNISLAKINL